MKKTPVNIDAKTTLKHFRKFSWLKGGIGRHSKEQYTNIKQVLTRLLFELIAEYNWQSGKALFFTLFTYSVISSKFIILTLYRPSY